jgi:transcriptional regulator with XRE-family HTH domain
MDMQGQTSDNTSGDIELSEATMGKFIDAFTKTPLEKMYFAEAQIAVAITHFFHNLRKEQAVSKEELASRIGRTVEWVEIAEDGAYGELPLPILRTVARALGRDLDLERLFTQMDHPIYTGQIGKSLLDEVAMEEARQSHEIGSEQSR